MTKPITTEFVKSTEIQNGDKIILYIDIAGSTEKKILTVTSIEPHSFSDRRRKLMQYNLRGGECILAGPKDKIERVITQ